MYSVYFLTLGCSKNDVDTSLMESILDTKRYQVSTNISLADVIVVNTCAFIDSAKEESINTIVEVAGYKTNANCKKLILAGCLAQRYSEELIKELPEVDGIIGTGELVKINEILDKSFKNEKPIEIDNVNSDFIEGYMKKDVNKTEYVKISEGCNNNCSYCIIPKLRGRNRSRSISNIYDEVNYLVEKGTEEIILIAQNTTDYGIDIYGEYKLRDLISKLSEIDNLKWIRVMYLYPDHFTDELINEFKNNDKLLKYVDIPLQHISDNVLRKMNRKTTRENIENLILKLRLNIPDIVIRTTIIVGFPGETKSDFMELLNFVEKFKFDKLGAFTYSREENTPAYSLENQIEEEEKENRKEQLLSLQQNISNDTLFKKIGKEYEVLIEEKENDTLLVGRTYMDSPEIDGVVYVNVEESNVNIGDFINVKILDSLEYDLIGEII